MGGVCRIYTNVFGYEQEDGTIISVIINDLFPDIFFNYVRTWSIPQVHKKHELYSSADVFFSEENFNKDDSKWRILYKFDGIAKIRCIDHRTGEFMYKKY